jgi:hypothetical protein
LTHLLGEAFELSAADVLEVPPRRRCGGLLVEVHGHAVALGDRGGRRPGQLGARLHRRALDRHEGDHVHGAEARVLARVLPEIDVAQRFAEQGQHRRTQGGGVAGQRQDRAVVRRVRRDIEHGDALGRGHSLHDRGDYVSAASLADVRHALDHGHAALVSHVRRRGRGYAIPASRRVVPRGQALALDGGETPSPVDCRDETRTDGPSKGYWGSG